jgi:hypothetical protein
VFVPDAIEQLLGGDDPPLGGQQHLEDAELLVRQVEHGAAPVGLVPGRVQHDARSGQHGGDRRVGTTGQRFDTGQQLSEGERLAEVVVRAEA